MAERILQVMKAINQVSSSAQYVGGLSYRAFYLDMRDL